MFIVKHIPTGLYYNGKRGRPTQFVEDRNKARVFRTHAGVVNCLGNSIRNPHREIDRHARPFFFHVLDTSVWEVIPITLETK